MKKRDSAILVFCFSFILIFCVTKGLQAYNLITAQEAFDMVSSGSAAMVDVRTLEEYVFVGSPALEGDGDPIAYLIPWEFLDGTDEEGNLIYTQNPDFDALFKQTFGDDFDQALIIICRSGNRSTYAALRAEEQGFTNIYEVDNKLKELASFPGGRGGVQGSSYKGLYDGYRGYPGRLSIVCVDSEHKAEGCSDCIDDEHDSVAWMDLGLPITQKIDPLKIPKLKKSGTQSSKNVTNSSSQAILPFMPYQSLLCYGIPNYHTFSYSFPSYGLAMAGSHFPSFGFLGNTYQTLFYAQNTLFPGFSSSQSSESSVISQYNAASAPDCGG
jgi:rhodanese-related sulfurtransferase